MKSWQKVAVKALKRSVEAFRKRREWRAAGRLKGTKKKKFLLASLESVQERKKLEGIKKHEHKHEHKRSRRRRRRERGRNARLRSGTG